MMRKLAIYLYTPGTITHSIFKRIKYLIDEIKYNVILDKVFIRNAYKKVFSHPLNLHDPQSFNEKLLWLTLYDRKSTKTLCADKYAVRDYVASQVGAEYLIPLALNTENPLDVVAENLPEFPVIAKTNHASGQVFIIKDLRTTDFSAIQESFRFQLRKNFYHGHREWQYKHIVPSIVVEKLLLDEQGDIPKDYKVHCFHGRPHYIQVDSERFSEHKRCIYDTNWTLLDIAYNKPKGEASLRPTKLDEILMLAAKLSKDFIYVRADFYQVNDRVYFGELTFTPEAGRGKFSPSSIDIDWGKLIHLP
jgi:hypothetical protein